jgi:predicted GIY-YIG superfamily endonuclease
MKKGTRNTTILYVLNMVGTDNYKIGITNDLKTRISSIRYEYPHREIEDVAFLYCANRNQATSYESNLHGILRHKAAQGEWFVLTHYQVVLLLKFMDEFLNGQVHMDSKYRRNKETAKGERLGFIPTLYNKPYHF